MNARKASATKFDILPCFDKNHVINKHPERGHKPPEALKASASTVRSITKPWASHLWVVFSTLKEPKGSKLHMCINAATLWHCLWRLYWIHHQLWTDRALEQLWCIEYQFLNAEQISIWLSHLALMSIFAFQDWGLVGCSGISANILGFCGGLGAEKHRVVDPKLKRNLRLGYLGAWNIKGTLAHHYAPLFTTKYHRKSQPFCRHKNSINDVVWKTSCNQWG